MIITSKYKFTFLKNPKTGGQSVHEALDGLDLTFFERRNKLLSRLTFSNSYYGTVEIESFARYHNLQYFIDNNVIPENVDEYTNYVVIRDPVERYMSFCRHVRKFSYLIGYFFKEDFDKINERESGYFMKDQVAVTNLVHKLSKPIIDKYHSISIQEIAERVIDFPFNKISRFDLLRIPQNYYYTDPRVTVIDYANLQQELYNICERHNTYRTYTLPFVNVGDKYEIDQFSNDLINKVKNMYSEDVEFYDRLKSK